MAVTYFTRPQVVDTLRIKHPTVVARRIDLTDVDMLVLGSLRDRS